jgi:4-diphosphocytidyl-2-C-methyl-D-erythritol kinase
MDSITLKAPAKVNLYLDVLGKREDGYHNIITVFERIGLFDIITLSKRSRGVALSSGGGIPKKDNLALKAARLILSESGLDRGIHISIKKRIPVAAGLGGGSSDAATTLIGINKLYQLGYNRRDLMKLARPLGADVPFFIFEHSFAIGRERGDKIEELGFKPPKMWHLLVFPGVKKLSKDVYRALKLGLTRKRASAKMILRALKIGDLDLIKEAAYNRLEGPALDRDPGLSALKSNLVKLGMKGALLSGSGPSIFVMTRTRKEAVLLKEKILKALGLKTEKWQMYVVPTF